MENQEKNYFNMSSNQRAYVIKNCVSGIVKSAILSFAVSVVDGLFLMFGDKDGLYVDEFRNVLIYMIICGISGGIYRACQARVECLDSNANYYKISYINKKLILLTDIVTAAIGAVSFLIVENIALHTYNVSIDQKIMYFVGGALGIIVGLMISKSKAGSMGKMASFNPLVGIMISALTTCVVSFIAFIIIEASQGLSAVILFVLFFAVAFTFPLFNGIGFIYFDDWG